MVFIGRGFTSEGQELGSGFSAAVCKYRLVSATSSPVPKDKRSCFSQGERSTVQLPFDHTFALRK